MRRTIYFISALIFTVGLVSCKESIDYEWPDDDNGILNQVLVIHNTDGTEVKTKNKLSIGSEKAFPIGSVFVGGAIADPMKGSSHRCHFYKEAFTEGPRWDEVKEMIYISGFRHKGTEYTAPGQYIDLINIWLDPSMGYGENMRIPMNQGEYEGGNELVKDVKINSYKFSTYQEDEYIVNDDAKIDIRILLNDGTTLAILFAGKTPTDSYI